MNNFWTTINDSDESLQGKGGFGKFGLNENCHITKCAFNGNAGKDNSPANAFDIEININGNTMNRRLFEPNRIFDSKGNELTDTNSPEFMQAAIATINALKGVIVHAIKSLGVTQEAIDKALVTPPNNFMEFCMRLQSLIPANYQEIPVDVFLEYQWNISPNQSQTYLEIPKNLKGGRFLCPHINPVGSWHEDKSNGLKYVDDQGNIHPFTRNQNYMESNKAIQQKDTDTVSATDVISNVANQAQTTATKSIW